MLTSQWVVTATGILLIVAIAWFFWGPKKGGSQAVDTSSGYQEALIQVKNGYSPDIIFVQRGKPVRLVFSRVEKNACSEMVVFPDFRKSAELPYGQKTAVEIVPKQTGTYPFTCQMGMYKGKIVVKE